MFSFLQKINPNRKNLKHFQSKTNKIDSSTTSSNCNGHIMHVQQSEKKSNDDTLLKIHHMQSENLSLPSSSLTSSLSTQHICSPNAAPQLNRNSIVNNDSHSMMLIPISNTFDLSSGLNMNNFNALNSSANNTNNANNNRNSAHLSQSAYNSLSMSESTKSKRKLTKEEKEREKQEKKEQQKLLQQQKSPKLPNFSRKHNLSLASFGSGYFTTGRFYEHKKRALSTSLG